MSETIKHRSLIFGIQHHWADLYRFWSSYAPAGKMAPRRGGGGGGGGGAYFLHRLIMGKPEKFSLSETTRHRVLIVGM